MSTMVLTYTTLSTVMGLLQEAELINSNTNVLCLQEVGAGQYHDYFVPHLAEEGYGGIYLPFQAIRGWMLKIRWESVGMPHVTRNPSASLQVDFYHLTGTIFPLAVAGTYFQRSS
jgi:mRNA deadenylase 3'-5' endonuclease subunit Ccr4